MIGRLWTFALLVLVGSVAHAATGFDYKYSVRSGDLNGDGLFDFYLEHRPTVAVVPVDDISIAIPTSKTVLNRFVLMRQADGTFTVDSNITSGQRAQAESWQPVRVGLSNGDYNGDGEQDLYIASLPSNLDPQEFREVVVLASSASTTLQTVDGLIGHRYYARVGDINNDGKQDLFITGNATRFVQDFLLTQVSTSEFAVISQPSAAQLATARLWPRVELPIYREDLNLDGYYDFLIEDLWKVVAGGSELIVYTTVNNGQAPAAAVNVSDPGGLWSKTRSDLLEVLTNGKPVLDSMYQQICIPRYDPGLPLLTMDHDWLFDGWPDPWYRDSFIDDFGVIQYSNGFASNGQTCYPRIVLAYNPNVQRLIRTWGDYIGLQGMNCIPCSERSEQIIFSETIEGQWIEKTWETISNEAAHAREQLWVLTGVVIAGSRMDTGIEFVDRYQDRFSATLGAVWVLSRPGALLNEDVGPPPPVPPASVQSTPGDPFQLPPEWDPNDRSKQQIRGRETGDSSYLGKNLERSGYPKPHADAEAHHIVQGGCMDAACIRAREILRGLGIDIDEAANGIWLPKSESVRAAVGTRTLAHRSFGMHKSGYYTEVLSRLEQARPGGAAQVRLALQEMREIMLRGETFW